MRDVSDRQDMEVDRQDWSTDEDVTVFYEEAPSEASSDAMHGESSAGDTTQQGRGWLSRMFGRDTASRRDELLSRLTELNDAVTQHSDAPANYMLRGEVYLELDDPEHALNDFKQAYALASEQVTVNDWGFIAQVVQDRAWQGYRTAWKRCRTRGQAGDGDLTTPDVEER